MQETNSEKIAQAIETITNDVADKVIEGLSNEKQIEVRSKLSDGKKKAIEIEKMTGAGAA